MCVKGVLILLFIAMLSRPAAGGGRETRAVASTETDDSTPEQKPEQKPDDDDAKSHMQFFEEMKKSAEDTSIKVGVGLEQ